ncbi:hypothetical protein AB1Y20_021286 [Prymnesium parvum]|uniref:Glycosyltransferase family 92 protein n=1 Tax=Prymnesium parvum TaxID=97485 RepID=A0AB34JJ50_PRYPA
MPPRGWLVAAWLACSARSDGTPSTVPSIRRNYHCYEPPPGSAEAAPAPCSPGWPCPSSHPDNDCAALCDIVPGCRSVVVRRHMHVSSNRSLCYMYARERDLLVPAASESSPAAKMTLSVCTLKDEGCPQRWDPAHALVLVVVLRYETQNVKDWLFYHTHLGVSQFVLISNECDAEAHANLMLAIADLPCAPKLVLIHGFRCAQGFQTKAYTDAVRLLLRHGESANTRVGFLDVDEFLVVRRRDEESDSGTAVDELFRQGLESAPMWELSAKPFGPALHYARPHGFMPANFLVGADLSKNTYGGYPKSMCLLSEMQKALENNQLLFPHPNPFLNGRWPHHCLPQSKAWAFNRTVARLNHYATRHESEWQLKCQRPNPTFSQKSREGKHFCSKEGIISLFAGMSDHVDLMLFEALDRKSLVMPLRFLIRSEPAPAVGALLEQYCTERQGQLKGAALALCNDAMPQARNVSSGAKAGQVACAQLYGCSPPQPHAPTDAPVRHPPSARSPPASPCDCPKLRWDSLKNKDRCRRRADDGSYCFLFCCRTAQFNGRTLKKALQTRKHN